MNWNPQEENRIKRYWLDDLADAERAQVEARLINEDEYDQLARLIEQELIDDYARGALNAAERMLFERNFPLTPERQQLLWQARQAIAAAKRVEQQAQSAATPPLQPKTKTATGSASAHVAKRAGQWWQFLFTPGWRWAAAALLLLGAGVSVWRWWSRAPEATTDLAHTRATIQRVAPRSYEPRLSKLAYASYVVQMGGEARDKKTAELEGEENRWRLLLRRHPDAAKHYGLGQVLLARKQLERARAEFDAALRLSAEEGARASLAQPHQAQLHNDLGATLMELWSREQSRGETPEATALQRQSLEQFVAALRLDEGLLEARFNRALLYERAGQTTDARAAWDDYLAREADPNWAREAQEHRNALK